MRTRSQAEALVDRLIDAFEASSSRSRDEAHQRYFELRENMIATLMTKEIKDGNPSSSV